MQEKVRTKKIQDLVDLGKLDGDKRLPKYPSAQLYRNMSEDEKDDLQDIVVSVGKRWDAYEKEMKSLWPKSQATQSKPPKWRVSKR